MTKDPRQWASVEGKIIGGTAKPTYFPSVIPAEKSAKEVFWVTQLFNLLPEYEAHEKHIQSNEDDSEGNHDVLVDLPSEQTIGIQVTELTSELRKSRTSLSNHHTDNIIKALQKVGAQSPSMVAVSISVSGIERKKPKFPTPTEIAEAIKAKSIEGFTEEIEIVNEGNYKLVFQLLKAGELAIANYKNIGVSVNYDALPVTLEMYENSVNYLVNKKSNSKSPWLVIWSSSFWQDGHWLGTPLLEYMRQSFKSSQFVNVYFIESMDGEGFFQANVHWHKIK
ncbi:MAG: hypothetical protein ACKN9W_20375 [Methylococcus sp.]